MFKTLCLAAGLVASALFAGCATAPIPITIPTPAQLTADFCPVVNADLAMLSTSTLLTSAQKTLLTTVIIPDNQAVCAAGAAINITDLQTLNATAFPALITLVGALPMIPNQPAILLGLTLAEPILTQIINSLPVPAAPAVAASGASAPVAASA
jgi:hypothetical protein